MKMTSEDLKQLYSILCDQTPLSTDCGLLCQAACCKEDGETLCGVYLLDAEVQMLTGVAWADIIKDEQSGRPMLMCKSACERSKRPWLCRIFPLCPIEDGKKVRVDSRARAVCPLARSGIRGMSPEFRKSVARSAMFLSKFEDGREFIREWENLEAEFREPLW